ncbi:uncharacterized protein LOC103315533 [Nasonia vitripennis]|uniref:Odorant receptor n=1 Tax=Nasonia vitripennis TaxID=7425 RepID=A0A7M7IKL5_NASVI|nr:uncharacterized protein LOC103315533 [Nasonia vitripennis]
MTFLVVLLAVVFFPGVCRTQECYDDGNEFCIDQNDILSVDLLPGSFLLMDQHYAENMSRSAADSRLIADGSFVKAFDEMEFHRKRMNEYLCHGYMAEEIFKEIGAIRAKRGNDLQTANSIPDILGEQNVTVHDKLLSDEGSSKYKDWLHRTTTLDDIYRHYAPHKVLKKKHEVHEDPEPEGEIEEFEGELTGYSMPSPMNTGKMGKPGGVPSMMSGGIEKGDMLSSPTGYGYPNYGPPMHHDFVPTIHEQHIYLPSHDDHEDDEYHHGPVYHSKGKGHDLSIRDFFEIALTALAFLAFGLFIIQLLMNITNPMTMTTAATQVVTDIDQRFKRHVFDAHSLNYSGNEELNELSHRVLRSIEAVLVAQADHGMCLRRLLCEDNRFSRDTSGGRRIWIPVWSLGMSWASGRVLNRDPWTAMLDSVKASVLGLGRANCAALYPECDLWRERVKRRRRRRK